MIIASEVSNDLASNNITELFLDLCFSSKTVVWQYQADYLHHQIYLISVSLMRNHAP